MTETYNIVKEHNEELQSQFNLILYSVLNLRSKIEILNQQYDELFTAAMSVSAIRYDKDKVQTSPRGTDDVIVKMIDIDNERQKTIALFTQQFEFLNRLFLQSKLTQEEYSVMYLRFLSSRQLTFQEIANRLENTDRKRCFYVYTKAYDKVRNNLMMNYKIA